MNIATFYDQRDDLFAKQMKNLRSVVPRLDPITSARAAETVQPSVAEPEAAEPTEATVASDAPVSEPVPVVARPLAAAAPLIAAAKVSLPNADDDMNMMSWVVGGGVLVASLAVGAAFLASSSGVDVSGARSESLIKSTLSYA
jgi:hypothetical protein